MGQTYRCARCGGVFETADDWTEEDRLAEKEALFGNLPTSACDLVCDECYRQMGFGATA